MDLISDNTVPMLRLRLRLRGRLFFIVVLSGIMCCGEGFLNAPSTRGFIAMRWGALVRKSVHTRKGLLDLPLAEPDYLITDSEDMEDRPGIVESIATLRNAPALLTTIVGVAVSGFNIVGDYGEGFFTALRWITCLGMLSGILDCVFSRPPYGKNPVDGTSPNIRCGAVDDAFVNFYAGVYSVSAAWLALRTSPVCPPWLIPLDPVMGLFALFSFLISLVIPALTLIHENFQNLEQPLRFLSGVVRADKNTPSLLLPKLSDTEKTRVLGMLSIGFVGCVYAPEATFLMLRGQEWWSRVGEAYPGQLLVEPCTSMFGLLATQASMIAHRAGKSGVAPFRTIVPAFSLVCFFLAIFPCVFVLYWLADDISFFNFYRL